MNVIDFTEKKRARDHEQRYEYIKSMCQFQRPDLFDKLIAEQELTVEQINSCTRFIIALRERDIDPLTLFEEATFIHEDEFYEDWGINWWIAIDAALVYFATARHHHEKFFKEVIIPSNPFIGSN